MTPTTPRRNSPSDAPNSASRDAELAQRAIEALANSYSPYSSIRVGAALLASDGRIFTGCNVENASFGLTMCAERTALVKAVSENAREFQVLAVATRADQALMPCGACRQALYEFAPRLRILVVGRDGVQRETFLGNLLPEAFGPADVTSGRADVRSGLVGGASGRADVSSGPTDVPSGPADVH